MYNKILFLDSIESRRTRRAVEFCEKQKGWFSYEKLFDFSVKEAKKVHIGFGHKDSQGRPSRTRNMIKNLIKWGYLLADPKKGLKVNPDFVPENQKDLLIKV